MTQAELHMANPTKLLQPDHSTPWRNDYSIEHISKAKLEKQGQLPDILDVVEDDVYQTNNDSDDESNSYNENNLLNENNSPNNTYNK